MQLILSFEELQKLISNVIPIITDKTLQEDLKAITIWVHNTETYAVVNNLRALCCLKLDADTVFEDKEKETSTKDMFFQFRAKDFLTYINVFNNMSRTYVQKVVLHLTEMSATIQIYETAKKDDKDAAMYHQQPKLRLVSQRIPQITINNYLSTFVGADGEVSLTFTDSVEEVDGKQLSELLSCFTPLINVDLKDTQNTRLYFSKDYVYTILAFYAVMYKNTLPSILSDFVLPCSSAIILAHYAKTNPTLKLVKEVRDGRNEKESSVIFHIIAEGVRVDLTAMPKTKLFPIEQFITLPENHIVIDRDYFMDVLKRLEATADRVDCLLDLTNKTCKLRNRGISQEIPIFTAKGTGTYEFTLDPAIFANFCLKHLKTPGTNLFLHVENADGKVCFGVDDETSLWHTKARGIGFSKGDYTW